jgi:hypothetical protein
MTTKIQKIHENTTPTHLRTSFTDKYPSKSPHSNILFTPFPFTPKPNNPHPPPNREVFQNFPFFPCFSLLSHRFIAEFNPVAYSTKPSLSPNKDLCGSNFTKINRKSAHIEPIYPKFSLLLSRKMITI